MTNFALEIIDAVKGSQVFEKLVVDGVCLFDEFEKDMSKQYSNEIVQLYTYMNDVANLRSLPYTKFHSYDNNDPRGWEFKTKHLRLYCVARPGGKIVVLGGQKSQQKKDEKIFRHYQKLLADYLKEQTSKE